MNPFEQITQPLIQALQGLAIPAAVIGVTFAIIGYILIPLVPTLQQQRGYIQMALLGVAAIGFIPALVTFFAGLGGTGGGASMPPLLPVALAMPVESPVLGTLAATTVSVLT
jgi:hypothetical protein